MNLNVLGLFFDIIGVLIVTFTEITNPFYNKEYDKPFNKRYWWFRWNPFYKDSKTLRFKIKWNRRFIVYGMVPPKYKLEFFGIILILVGFVLQILFYFVG